MNLQTFIKEIRINGGRSFTIEDVLEKFSVSNDYARVALSRLTQSGDIISPARGFYVIVPPEHQPYGCIPAEELVPLLMKHVGADYYVALLSAAAFFGASHQKPAKFQVISSKRFYHPLVFGEVELDFIYKKSIVNLPTQNFVVNTGYLKVASPELVVLDLFHYSHRVGGLNHIATVLSELIESVDPSKLMELAVETKASYELQRLGYILEKIETVDEKKKDKIIKSLLKYLNGKLAYYIPLAPELDKVGHPRSTDWKIIENTEIESDL